MKWKGKVRKDIERQKAKKDIERQKAKKKLIFAEIYDKKKTINFKSGKNLNMEKHFYMPRIFDAKGKLSKPALAVYPVMCSKADFEDYDKSFQISRENIGKLSGLATNTVDKAITELESFTIESYPLLERKKVEEGERHYFVYNVAFLRPNTEGLKIQEWKGNYIIFHTCIIDNGVWAGLSDKAKAVYLAMRHVSEFNMELYNEIENERIDDYRSEDYRKRKWEVCAYYSVRKLFKLAGIDYYKPKDTINELEHTGLLEKMHDTRPIFKVYLLPKKLKKYIEN